MVSSVAIQNARSKTIEEAPWEATAHSEVALPQERDVARNLGTFTGRTEIWASGLNAIKEKPCILLFGMTDGQAARVPLVLNREIYHMHNTWLEMLLLGGVPGLVLHLWLCVLVVTRCMRLFFAKTSIFSQRNNGGYAICHDGWGRGEYLDCQIK